MHHLLKAARLFELMARSVEDQKPLLIDQVKEDKRQQIRKALETGASVVDIVSMIKKYYNIIKQDDQLFRDVAARMVAFIGAGYDLSKKIGAKYAELHSKMFQLVLERDTFDNLYPAAKMLEWWGAGISPDLIRQFTHKILVRVKAEKELEGQTQLHEPLNFIRSLITNDKIKPYLNVPLFEKVLSYHDPSRLPVFEPHAQRFNTTDIMKMLFSRDRINSNFNMRLPDLLDIINKSTPQAQELLRNTLWQEYRWGSFDSRKFMLDESNRPMDVNLKPIEIHGKIGPASDVSFGQYSDEDQAEREKWRQVFMDFKKVPARSF